MEFKINYNKQERKHYEWISGTIKKKKKKKSPTLHACGKVHKQNLFKYKKVEKMQIQRENFECVSFTTEHDY